MTIDSTYGNALAQIKHRANLVYRHFPNATAHEVSQHAEAMHGFAVLIEDLEKTGKVDRHRFALEILEARQDLANVARLCAEKQAQAAKERQQLAMNCVRLIRLLHGLDFGEDFLFFPDLSGKDTKEC